MLLQLDGALAIRYGVVQCESLEANALNFILFWKRYFHRWVAIAKMPCRLQPYPTRNVVLYPATKKQIWMACRKRSTIHRSPHIVHCQRAIGKFYYETSRRVVRFDINRVCCVSHRHCLCCEHKDVLNGYVVWKGEGSHAASSTHTYVYTSSRSTCSHPFSDVVADMTTGTPFFLQYNLYSV